MASSNDYLTPSLLRSLGSYAAALTTRARNLAPSHIRSAISSRVDKSKKGKVSVIITAAKKGVNGAEDVAAWEFGSGKRSRLKRMSPNQIAPQGKYVIKPKKPGGFLVFPWDKAEAYDITTTDDGQAKLRSVLHPGIQAANGGKGYIAPAIKATRKTLEESIDESVRDAVGLTLKRAFSGGK